MYVYDRSGNYKGRAGGPVRDVRTGKLQHMGPPRPTPTAKKKGGCFKAAALVVGPLALAVAGVVAHVADWV